MSREQAIANRVQKTRDYLATSGLDAVIVQSNASLRWLTGAKNTFDDELAHTAFITKDTLSLRTDSRYFETFKEHLGTQIAWELDGGLGAAAQTTHAAWLAEKIANAKAQKIGIENSVSLGYFDKLKDAVSARGLDVEFVHLDQAFENLRMVKDEEELECLTKAQAVSDEALTYIVGYMKAGMSEQEVAAELEHYMVSHGANGVSFATILASGPNGALPHARPGERKLQESDLVVIDFGALVDDYHADMTRTVSIGEPSPEQKEAYEVVREAHEKAAAAVHAGVNGASIHAISAAVIDEAGYGEYFNHGLGHGVGIEIHENPRFSPTWDSEIPQNSVVTIEPGVYLPGKFGIRLEDTGVVTSNGFEPFTSIGHELIVV